MPNAADPPNTPPTYKIAVLGAGMIGLCCAWELADRGAEIVLFDPRPAGQGASWAAAGMLGPAFEAMQPSEVHTDLAAFCLAGADVWDAFAARLQSFASQPIGYVAGPSLAVAKSDAQEAHLATLRATLTEKAIAFETLGIERALSFEPALSPDLKQVLQLPTDGHVDNRRVVKALLAVCDRHPRIQTRFRQTPDSIDELLKSFDQVLITAGWESNAVHDVGLPMEPVSGQLLSVSSIRGMPTRTIRAGNVYIAPKSDRIVIGATVEPGTARDVVDDDAVAALLDEASALCPTLKEGRVLETWFGVRPGLPDHAPAIGRTDNPYVFIASGHHRNGILLGPLTAQWVADMMIDANVPALAEPFSPNRFARAAV